MKRFTAILASLIIASSVLLSFTVFAEPDSVTGEDPYVQENIQYDANGDAYIKDENGNITYYTLNSYGYFVPVNEASSEENSEEPSEEPSAEPSEESSTEPSEPSSEKSSEEPSTEPSTVSSKEPSESEASENSKENSKPSSSKGKDSEIPLINYKLTPLKMNIALPNDVYAILRSGEQNEAALKVFKMTEKEAIESLRKSNMYLKGSPEDFSYDITVTMTEDDDSKTINNFTELDDKDLIEITNSLTAQEAYTSCTQKKYGDVLYLSLNYHSTDSGNDIAGIQNYTIVNGQKITITLQTRGKAITDEQSSILEAVMKSVSFTEIAPPAVHEDNSDKIRELKIVTIATAAVCVILFIVLIVVLTKKAKRKKLASKASDDDNFELPKKPSKSSTAAETEKKRTIGENKQEETQTSDKKTDENEQGESQETNIYTSADFELFETQPLTEKVEIYSSKKSGEAPKAAHIPEAPKYTPPGSVEFMTADITTPATLTPEEAGLHLTTETIIVPDESDSFPTDTSLEETESMSVTEINQPIGMQFTVEDEPTIENQTVLKQIKDEQLIEEKSEDEQTIEQTSEEQPIDGQITFEQTSTDIADETYKTENSTDDNSEKQLAKNEVHETKESSLKSFLGKIKRAVVPEIDEDAFEPETEAEESTDEKFLKTTETENRPAANEETVQAPAPVMPKAVNMPASIAPVVPKKVSCNDEQPVSRYEKLFGKSTQPTAEEVTATPTQLPAAEKTESRFEMLFGVKNEITQTSENETFSDIYAAIDGADNVSSNDAHQQTKSDESIVFEKLIQGNEENIHDRKPGSSIPKLNDTPSETNTPESKPQTAETESRFEKLFGKNAPESISYSQSQAQRFSETLSEKKPSAQDDAAIKLEKIHVDNGKSDKKSGRRKK